MIPTASMVDLFRSGYAEKRAAVLAQDLDRYPEHRDIRFQADFVARLRVAVRMNIARAFACQVKGRPARAARAAYYGGGYFAEYRKHLRQLKAIGGIK